MNILNFLGIVLTETVYLKFEKKLNNQITAKNFNGLNNLCFRELFRTFSSFLQLKSISVA